jgi:hypothetical protein
LQSLRLGTAGYDFDAIKGLKKYGQGFIFDIKSKVDGKTYVGKRLQYKVGSEPKNAEELAIKVQAEREMNLLIL